MDGFTDNLKSQEVLSKETIGKTSTRENQLSIDELLSDLDQSESGMLVRDLTNRTANPPDKNSCDTRAQSPLVAELQNTCDLDVPQLYNQVQDSTFKILNHKFEAIGSGAYACAKDGESCAVVTNYHVSKLGPTDTTYFLQSNEQIYLGRATKLHSAANDLALIEPIFPDAEKLDLKPIKFGAPAAKSDSVLSVCFPTSRLNIPIVTAGTVLDPSGRVHVNDGNPGLSPPSVVTNQSIYGGCSGGPDFNKDGEFIGVTRASGGEGTVVIKSEHVQELLERYAQQRKSPQ